MSAKFLSAEKAAAYRNLKIRTYDSPGGLMGDRVILCLDGGGIRGILTIQLLKKIEEIAGMPCHAFCDLVAGTSTGAIIAGLVAMGKTAEEVQDLYEKFVKKVFIKRGLFGSRFVNLPGYDKSGYRNTLADVIKDISLHEACLNTGLDILITAKDVQDNQEIFFTCFNNDGIWEGTFKDALLRTVLEATMSAPTFFSPLDRFVDGGTTTYNNPSSAAFLEAIEYGGKGKYEEDKTTMLSLGTGISVRSISAEEAAQHQGVDIAFWLNYVLDAASQDASVMQTDLFRSNIFRGVDYRRFQLSFDSEAIKKMPDADISDMHMVDADTLHDLTDKELDEIQMDDVHKFELVQKIGTAMVDYIMLENKFQSDLTDPDTKRDQLVTTFNSIEAIKANIINADWINMQKTK